jgi:hypothetical protein
VVHTGDQRYDPQAPRTSAKRNLALVQGKISYLAEKFVLQLLAQKLQYGLGNSFNNRATGVFDGQDRRRCDQNGERERSQVC